MLDERVSRYNEYMREKETNSKSLEAAIEYLSVLKERLHGVETKEELKMEMNRFLTLYSVPKETLDLLTSCCEELGENDSVYKACNYVVDILENEKKNQEKESEKTNATLSDINENISNHLDRQLDSSGVSIQGDLKEMEEKLESEKDIDKLKENVDRVVSYLEERKKMIGEKEIPVEISVDQVTDVLENAGESTILNTVLEEEEKQEDLNGMDGVELDEDGSLVIDASTRKKESINFIKMMMVGLLSADKNPGLAENFSGMKIVKEQQNTDDFQVKFGNFSKNKDKFPEDREVESRLSKLINSFNTYTDYDNALKSSSIELSLMQQMLETHILGKEGKAQIAVRSKGEDLEFAFGLGEEYQNVAEALKTNGAVTSQTVDGSYICNVSETYRGNELTVLSLANETLDVMAMNMDNPELKKVPQKVLTNPENGQIGNASFYILIAVTALEILILSFAIYFLR